MLNKVSQAEKDKYHIRFHFHVESKEQNKQTKQEQTHIQRTDSWLPNGREG